MVSFNKEDDEKDDLINYDAEEAVKKQLEKEQRQNETEKLQQQFDDIYKSEYEEARYKKPSAEVMVYYNVYHHFQKDIICLVRIKQWYLLGKNAAKIAVLTQMVKHFIDTNGCDKNSITHPSTFSPQYGTQR